MIRKTTIATVLGTALTGAALLAAPAGASAASTTTVDPQIGVSYTLNGMTMTYHLTSSGTQHDGIMSGEGLIHPTSPSNYNLSLSNGDGLDGGDAPEVTCLNTGVNHNTWSGRPGTYTFKKPGTYTLTASGIFCGNNGGEMVTKKVTVTVPATNAQTPTNPAPSNSAPAPAPDASQPLGPKVQTDYVGTPGSDLPLWAAVGGFASIAVGGFSVAKRRRN